MSGTKYYMQCEEDSIYADSSMDVFYAERPFDTLDDAKRGAETSPDNAWHATCVIYECNDNILNPILIRTMEEDADWLSYDQYGAPA